MAQIGGNVGGLVYEKKVRAAIRKVEPVIPNFNMVREAVRGFDNTGADLNLKVDKQKVAFEIKKNTNAQMGGGTFKFDSNHSRFYFVGNDGTEGIDIPTAEMIQDVLGTKSREVAAFINFLQNYPPKDYHQRIKGLPVTCTKEAWMAAVDKGLLRNLNTNIPFSTKFIADHYAKKNVNYIQIGGAGLFYLKNNPINLPIPQLNGNINIELRLGANQGKENKSMGIWVVTGGIRAQARLKTKNISPYSLDNPDDVKFLFMNR